MRVGALTNKAAHYRFGLVRTGQRALRGLTSTASAAIDEICRERRAVVLGENGDVRIGAHTAIAGCVGIAGSARIGSHCTLGGAAMVLGHLELADHVHISAGSLVTRSLKKPGQYTGVFPIDDNASWEKNAATLRQLYALRTRLRALERKSSN